MSIPDVFFRCVTQWCKSGEGLSARYKFGGDCMVFIFMIRTCIPYIYRYALGQILRTAAVFHVLFHWETPEEIPQTISDDALASAINLVETCTQHAAYLGGGGGREGGEIYLKL